uniref:Ig-like domain-containing protein n=1 Tax=Hucho hucho TaxID=62062 RepID=A0A4W5M5R1_9TELE
MVLCLIIWLVLAVFCFGDHVQQQPEGVIATEGGLVTLSCQYNTSADNAYLYWYKQEANYFPKHMLSCFSIGSGDNSAGFKERFNASLNRLQLSDSAVYYCALQDTVCACGCVQNLVFFKVNGRCYITEPTVTGNNPTLSQNLNKKNTLNRQNTNTLKI